MLHIGIYNKIFQWLQVVALFFETPSGQHSASSLQAELGSCALRQCLGLRDFNANTFSSLKAANVSMSTEQIILFGGQK